MDALVGGGGPARRAEGMSHNASMAPTGVDAIQSRLATWASDDRILSRRADGLTRPRDDEIRAAMNAWRAARAWAECE